MSIIYDALQKTQKNREYLRLQNSLAQKKAPPRSARLQWMALGAFILVVGAAAGTLFSFYGLPAARPVAKFNAAVKPAPVVEPAVARFSVTDAKRNTEALPQAPISTQLAEDPLLIESEVRPVTASLPPQEKPAPAAHLEASTVLNTSKFTLNGVLISGADKMALINNQAYHVGDVVNGMKILEIEYNNVKLQNGKQIVELRVSV